ncbi:MAG TPA: tetratricopeptide repeat protein [Cyclobacteriaceae bacterium]|jgi:tetratricopeptide (TPR) repeat protein|nr:tetratricopeptide repeat protein [Cyclobacteriaceae bacterium]
MNRTIKIVFTLFWIVTQVHAQRLEQAKNLYEQKKYDQVKKILGSIEKDNTDFAAARYYLGRVAVDEKKFDDAVDYFKEATEANGKVAEYQVWLGDTYGAIAKDANVFKQGLLAPKMRNAWEAAIALDPKNINSRQSLVQFYLQAPGFMGGSVDKAKEVANQLLKIKPAEGHYQAGLIFLHEKKKPEAEKEFLEMVKLDPLYTLTLANYYIEQKQYDKAFALFEDALKKNPEDYAAIYQYGKTSALSGQKLDRGEEYLKKYLNYSPKQNEASLPRAKMRLGQIKEKKGQKAEAKKMFEEALKDDNSLKEAKEGLERVSK